MTDDKGSIWSAEVQDAQARVHVNGGSPFLLANLMGSALLGEEIDGQASDIPVQHVVVSKIPGAEGFPKAGGAIRIEQRDFTPERLASEIAFLAGDPGRLMRIAQAAKSAGTLDAAERLADLVMRVAGI